MDTNLTEYADYYSMRCAVASEDQGTTALSQALDKLNIPNEIHQTGGFTMCVYIKTGEDSYIYANAEGYEFRSGENDDESEAYYFGDEFDAITPQDKAKTITEAMKEKNLTAKEIN